MPREIKVWSTPHSQGGEATTPPLLSKRYDRHYGTLDRSRCCSIARMRFKWFAVICASANNAALSLLSLKLLLPKRLELGCTRPGFGAERRIPIAVVLERSFAFSTRYRHRKVHRRLYSCSEAQYTNRHKTTRIQVDLHGPRIDVQVRRDDFAAFAREYATVGPTRIQKKCMLSELPRRRNL